MSIKKYMLLIITAFFPLFCTYSHVFNHLKKVAYDSDHSYKDIPFVALINLDQRPEKFQLCTDQLEPHNIRPYRFSAVNGWELTKEAIVDVGLEFKEGMKTGIVATTFNNARILNNILLGDHEEMKPGNSYFSHCMAPGTIGIVLSHLSLIKHVYEKGYSCAWIMEDDIDVKSNPDKIPRLVSYLTKRFGKNGWDFLFTDTDITSQWGEKIPCFSYDDRRPDFIPKRPERFAERKIISKEIQKVGARFGMTSYIISRSGAKKILDFYKHHDVYLPIDIEFSMPNNIRIFSVREDIITNLAKSISDNGGPNYKEKENTK